MQDHDTAVILSPQTLIRHKGSHSFVYNRLTLDKLYCVSEIGVMLELLREPITLPNLARKLQQVMEANQARELIAQLLEHHLLEHSGAEQEISPESVWHRYKTSLPKNLCLLITHKCDLACKYCQVVGNLAPEKVSLSMSIETADAALDIFEVVSDPKGRVIIITGGEPLLNRDVVKHVVKSSRVRFGDIRIVLFTNGSKATSSIASFLADHGVQVLVSLDGPSEVNSFRQPSVSSHNRALAAYLLYAAAGCETGISAVVGVHNVALLDKEVISYFLDLQPASLGLNYPHYLVGHENIALIPMYLYVDKLLDTYRIAHQYRLSIEQISRVLVPLVSHVPRIRECTAVGKGITVDASGKIGTCKVLMVSGRQGIPLKDIDRSFLNQEPFVDWQSRSPLVLPECQECYALGVCGGGCAADSWIKYGNYQVIDHRICEFTKRLFDFFIWDILENHPDWLAGCRSYYSPSFMEERETYPEYFPKTGELSVSAGHQLEVDEFPPMPGRQLNLRAKKNASNRLLKG